jgi:hypothetical protein
MLSGTCRMPGFKSEDLIFYVHPNKKKEALVF